MATLEQIRQRPFVERAQTVAVHTRQLFARYLPNYPTKVDYLSVYSADEKDYERLNAQAQRVGEMVFDKHGPVYRLSSEARPQRLPSDIIRVREPGPSAALIGCADFLVPYDRAKDDLAGQPGITESLKPGYRIIQVTDPVAQVELYLPSQQLTTSLMGLA